MTHSFTIAGLFARNYVIFLKVFQCALRLQINFVNLILNDFNPYLTYFVYKGPSTIPSPLNQYFGTKFLVK